MSQTLPMLEISVASIDLFHLYPGKYWDRCPVRNRYMPRYGTGLQKCKMTHRSGAINKQKKV